VFERLVGSIQETFGDVLPSNFCVGCSLKGVGSFLKGLAEGAAISLATLAVVALLPEALAVAVTVGLVALGAYGIYQLWNNWGSMTNDQKLETVGGIIGGLLAGRFGGPKILPKTIDVPAQEIGWASLVTPGGQSVAIPVLTTPPIGVPVAVPIAGVVGTGASAMMAASGGGGGDDEAPETPAAGSPPPQPPPTPPEPPAAPATPRSGAPDPRPAPSAPPPAAVARGVEIVDSNEQPIGEFDGVLKDKFVEDKSAKGLATPHPRTGLPTQTALEWAEKQIFKKTVARIENLSKKAVATRSTVGGSPTVPTLAEIKGIRQLEFRIESASPDVEQAVQTQLSLLQAKYPDWKFTAVFGP
jgi:hypothetical protein